jgi:hypothetical protein
VWQGTAVGYAYGGTGLTALGTAGQLIKVNAGATALEYFTPTYISANQTITLTGDVTGSHATGIATTIANNAVTDGKFRQSAGLSVVGRTTNSTGNVADIAAGSDGDVLRRSGTSLGFGAIPISSVTSLQSTLDSKQSKVIQFAVSNETTALSIGTGKVTFRMPYALTLTSVRASLTTAQSSGSIFTVDINESGTSILSTKLTIDNAEKTSTTAVTAAVISDTSLADDAEITIDIDQIGDGTAKGLKITLIGT